MGVAHDAYAALFACTIHGAHDDLLPNNVDGFYRAEDVYVEQDRSARRTMNQGDFKRTAYNTRGSEPRAPARRLAGDKKPVENVTHEQVPAVLARESRQLFTLNRALVTQIEGLKRLQAA